MMTACPFCDSFTACVEPLDGVRGYVKCDECGSQGPSPRNRIHLAEELREYTAMKYAGDCKCGKCQLVPRELVERIYHALNASTLPE